MIDLYTAPSHNDWKASIQLEELELASAMNAAPGESFAAARAV